MNDTQTRLVHLEQALDGFAVQLGQLLNYVGTRAGTLAEQIDRLDQRLNAHMAHVLCALEKLEGHHANGTPRH
jgi:hypothetical protein